VPQAKLVAGHVQDRRSLPQATATGFVLTLGELLLFHKRKELRPLSTYVLMKLLESVPARYDLGIRLLTLGTVDKAYDRLVASIVESARVLDVGCGTGALAIRAAQRGARVKAIDISARMLAIAQRQATQARLGSRIDFCEMGVAELENEPPQSFDIVISGLCLSELTDDERRFALGQAYRLLRPGGLLLLADETRPQGALQLVYWMVRLPLVALTYLVTQTTTRAITDLPQQVLRAGFEILSSDSSGLGTFAELTARKPGET
jgi:demethylmenaquinone methyltransferase/2-methoxy-6-polyprenyl-1,4-benzoquinol methylase